MSTPVKETKPTKKGNDEKKEIKKDTKEAPKQETAFTLALRTIRKTLKTKFEDIDSVIRNAVNGCADLSFEDKNTLYQKLQTEHLSSWKLTPPAKSFDLIKEFKRRCINTLDSDEKVSKNAKTAMLEDLVSASLLLSKLKSDYST